jgi:hypothetical protein
MMVRGRWISALLVLAAGASSAFAQAPASNQATANSVASVLRSNPALASASRIAIDARNGQVTLSGVVPSSELKAEALAAVQRVAGVTVVYDGLAVGDARVMPAQFSQPIQIAHGGHGHGISGGEIVGGGIGGGAVSGVTGPIVSDPNAPLPEGSAVPGGTQASTPGYPNYAWPSYAPHPNFSAVGYPTVYPWQAWPNIGPFYPYPEVPLDWRAVTLRWDDGLWWLDFRKHYTRPFFTPYPFGIFGY